MKGFLLLAVAASALLVSAGPAAAAECWEICTSSTPCDTECGYDPGKGGPTTCGEYGAACDPGTPTCTPYYQVVSTTAVGAFPVYYASPYSCLYVVVYHQTHHDVNECAGSSDYTTCLTNVEGTRSDWLCCTYYYCFGQNSC